MIERLGRRLGLDHSLVEAFAAEARSKEQVRSSRAPSVAAEAAQITGDLIHHSLLALMSAKDFRPDSRFIARVLGTPVNAVNIAIQRLARFGLLEMESPNRWRDTTGAGSVDLQAFEEIVWARAAERLVQKPGPPTSLKEEITVQQPVRQFQILSHDPAASAKFYGDLFGWTVNDANALGYRQISTGPQGIAGGIWPAPKEAAPFVQLFVEVDDVRGVVDRAGRLGARAIVPPQALPEGDEMAILVDPEGIPFGIVRPASRPNSPSP